MRTAGVIRRAVFKNRALAKTCSKFQVPNYVKEVQFFTHLKFCYAHATWCRALWNARQRLGVWFCKLPRIHTKCDRTVPSPSLHRLCINRIKILTVFSGSTWEAHSSCRIHYLNGSVPSPEFRTLLAMPGDIRNLFSLQQSCTMSFASTVRLPF